MLSLNILTFYLRNHNYSIRLIYLFTFRPPIDLTMLLGIYYVIFVKQIYGFITYQLISYYNIQIIIVRNVLNVLRKYINCRRASFLVYYCKYLRRHLTRGFSLTFGKSSHKILSYIITAISIFRFERILSF